MKSEYSLNVDLPVKDAVKKVMEMPGSHDADGVYFSGRVKQITERKQIFMRQTSESEITFSDTFEWRLLMLNGYCFFEPVSKKRTRVTVKFKIRTMTVKTWKILIPLCFFIFLLSASTAAWFVYRPLLESGIKGSPSKEALVTTVLLLILFIWPLYGSLLLWFNSSKAKNYLDNFSNALGFGNDWRWF